MKIGRPVAFVVLAFMIGAIISQGSFAFADDSATNPFRAIWEAIGELQTRTDSLQAQIDDLKVQGVTASEEQIDAKVSETSLTIDIGSGDAGQTVIDVIATNTGPESAVGVKILTYYQMSLLDVYFINGAQCTDQARGIIECYVGTIESGGATQITIDATPLQLGEQAIITADVSSITQDSDPANNHAETVFMTSEAPVALPPQEQEVPVEQPASSGGSEEQPSESPETPAEEQPAEEQPAEEGSEQQSEGEQSSEEQTGEQASQEGGEQSTGEEGSESGEQSSEGGEQSSEGSGSEGSESGDSSGDAGSSDSSGDSGSDSGGSDTGTDSGSGDAGSDSGSDSSGDAGSSDSGDSGSDGSSSGGSDGGSGDGGGSDSGSSDSGGDSGGDSGSSGGDSGSTG